MKLFKLNQKLKRPLQKICSEDSAKDLPSNFMTVMSLFLFVFASLLYLPIGYAEPAQDFFNDSYDKAKQIFAI